MKTWKKPLYTLLNANQVKSAGGACGLAEGTFTFPGESTLCLGWANSLYDCNTTPAGNLTTAEFIFGRGGETFMGLGYNCGTVSNSCAQMGFNFGTSPTAGGVALCS